MKQMLNDGTPRSAVGKRDVYALHEASPGSVVQLLRPVRGANDHNPVAVARDAIELHKELCL